MKTTEQPVTERKWEVRFGRDPGKDFIWGFAIMVDGKDVPLATNNFHVSNDTSIIHPSYLHIPGIADKHFTPEEAEQCATLMGAAPDLLTALKDLHEVARRLIRDYKAGGLCEEIEATLAKAEPQT